MITLSYANLTATTAAHSRVLVAFCAEFSPHCLALRGELAEAAVALRGAAVLALVDSKFEDEDRRQPIATLSWYEDGTVHPYTGGRVAQSITQWVWSRLNASGTARDGPLEATGAKKDELRRLAEPLRPMQSQLGKLRSDMMKWYCVGGQHADIPPCKVRRQPRLRIRVGSAHARAHARGSSTLRRPYALRGSNRPGYPKPFEPLLTA